MPRYFFNIRDHDEIKDHMGIELADAAEAARHAQHVANIAKTLLPKTPFRLIVTDEGGAIIHEVAMPAK